MIIQLDDCKLNAQAGLRGNQPVVACGLIYSQGSPLHYIQIDRPMDSLDAAKAYVEAIDLNIAREIYAEMMASDGHVIEAFNRVFSASAQQAATRIHQLDAAANRGRKPR